MTLTRERIVEAVQHYFATVDAGDVEATVACFAPGAWLRCENIDQEFSGHAAIREFYARIAGRSTGMLHEVQRVVVDCEAGRAACELRSADTLQDGTAYDMDNCTFFDLAAEGRFTRVHFWLGAAP